MKMVSCMNEYACFSCFSKKITDKRRIALKKPSENHSSSKSNNNTTSVSTADIESHSNGTNIEPVSSHSLDKNPFDYCSICHIPFDIAAAATATNDIDSDFESKIDKFVSCRLCLSQICKSPQCGVWLAKHNHWECSNCHHFDSVAYVPTYEWIFKQLNRRFDDKASAVERVTKTAPIHDTNPKSDDGDVMLELNGKLCCAQHKTILIFNSLCRSLGVYAWKNSRVVAISDDFNQFLIWSFFVF